MNDTFLLGAGFSKAICTTMPTMKELYELLEPLIGTADGFSREAYEYASGNVETLLSYYAIPSPHDDTVELLRKQRVTTLLEIGIGALLQERENEGAKDGLNPNGSKLVSKWHEQRSHVLTTNYDTLVERIAAEKIYTTASGDKDKLYYTDLYPIPVSSALSRDGGMVLGSNYPDTFTLYKLHGSTTWYKSTSETNFDPIYGLSHEQFGNPRHSKFIADKRRFIVPPVYDKSSLLNHESIRNLWWQARNNALRQADNLYVIGYSLPETDAAMHTLLWEGTRADKYARSSKKSLYVVDVDKEVSERYAKKLGTYYDVKGCYAGNQDAFDRFVEEYVKDTRSALGEAGDMEMFGRIAT